MGVVGRWNHNIHSHRTIHEALPARTGSVLDVGCGSGELCRELAARADRVLGIDVHAPSIERARAGTAAPHVTYEVADLFDVDGAFDAVVSVAALHHMDEGLALARMATLLRPGGILAVVGLARSTRLRDVALDAVGLVAMRLLRLRHGYWEHDAPTVWPPPRGFAEVEAVVAATLPGAAFRRHLLFRYSVTWRRP